MFQRKTKALSNEMVRDSFFLIPEMKAGEIFGEFDSLARARNTHMLLPLHLLPSHCPSKNCVSRGKAAVQDNRREERKGKGKGK